MLDEVKVNSKLKTNNHEIYLESASYYLVRSHKTPRHIYQDTTCLNASKLQNKPVLSLSLPSSYVA